MAAVREIRVYPVKALDPVVVESAEVLASGALAWDRRFALVDARGRFVNGKNRPEIHAVRAAYDLARGEVSLDGRVYSLSRQGVELAAWFSDRLGEPVAWRENEAMGFPDDTVSPGPTLVSEASINTVAAWFAWDRDETRLRFRANIEAAGLEPFEEDRWYGRTIRVGTIAVHAVNPCARCMVPSRHPRSGAQDAGFQKRFAELRRQHLPAWAGARHFDHTYRFTVNTRIAAEHAGTVIHTGDELAA